MFDGREDQLTKERISGLSWLALLGFVATLPCLLLGVAVGSWVVVDNDEAVVGGLVWGTIVGVGVGGALVGYFLSVTGESNRLIRWMVSPGSFISLPILVSGLLNHDLQGALPVMSVLVAVSVVCLEIVSRAVPNTHE